MDKVEDKDNMEIDPKWIERVQQVKANRESNKFFCYHCKTETKQKILFEKGELIFPNEVVFFDESTGKKKQSVWTIEGQIWKVSECQGCEKINLNVYRRYGPLEDDVLIHQFPTKDFRPFPKWITHISRDFTELLCEIYLSLNAGSLRLPLMGARTLLDMFICDKIGDTGTFKSKIQKLVDENYISKSSQELLEIALEYGHATIHRNYQLTKDEINGVLDIIENLLHIEALTNKTETLKKMFLKRKENK